MAGLFSKQSQAVHRIQLNAFGKTAYPPIETQRLEALYQRTLEALNELKQSLLPQALKSAMATALGDMYER